MGEINLTDSRGRDAVVSTRAAAARLRIRWVDENGRQILVRRIIKATLDHDIAALTAKFGSMESLGQAILDGDPEINLELCGSYLTSSSRVYIGEDNEVVRQVTQTEVIVNPDGSERDRRLLIQSEQNISEETPLKWTGKLMKKSEVYNRFVFSSVVQITHVNGLTYDFLYGMATELAEKESVMLLGAGPKGNQPLILRRGGIPFRGFLEGRVDGERYALLLHLSNQELKTPKGTDQ